MSDPLDFDYKTTLLGELTPEQLDYVDLGLVNAFGATLSRPPEAKGFFIIETEAGAKLGIHPACTVQAAWQIAEKSTTEGGAPAVVAGAVNILHHTSLN